MIWVEKCGRHRRMIVVSKVCSEQIGKFLHLGRSICLRCPLAIQEVVLASKMQGWSSDRDPNWPSDSLYASALISGANPCARPILSFHPSLPLCSVPSIYCTLPTKQVEETPGGFAISRLCCLLRSRQMACWC